MKLIVSEYLRTLKERDELDRLLPDLILEMGYTIVARPETGNRQDGVDIAARGRGTNGESELLLLVVKRGDIGRNEWDSGKNSVRQSINEIFDVYLKSCVEPQDKNSNVRIILVTNGELKQTVYRNWTGFVDDHKNNANIEFWGADKLAEYVEEHLLNEFIFHDEDRQDLRRALALSGDSEYDRKDLYRIFQRALDLNSNGHLLENPKTGKRLIKAFRVVNLSAKIFANWTLTNDGDSRQGLFAFERALLWFWHRVQLEGATSNISNSPFISLWNSYLDFSVKYYSRLQPYYFTKNSLTRGYFRNGAEASIVAFEQVGILASFILFMTFCPVPSDKHAEVLAFNLNQIGDALASFIEKNGICSSPCLDSHSQDITLALMALVSVGKIDQAKQWLRKLFRNIDYSYKAKRYIPVSIESMEELSEEGGWLGEHASDRMMSMSWTLATIAGWCAIFDEKEIYKALLEGKMQDYPKTCIQLWHPEEDLYQHMYFHSAHFESGATQAPIELPESLEKYKKQMSLILNSDFKKAVSKSPAAQSGLLGLDFIALRHYSTPVPPATWYSLLDIKLSK